MNPKTLSDPMRLCILYPPKPPPAIPNSEVIRATVDAVATKLTPATDVTAPIPAATRGAAKYDGKIEMEM